MKTAAFLLLALAGLACHLPAPAQAQQHRAVRLGNPATRFAPPLATPDDLRARFRDDKLRPDIVSVLKDWNWRGNIDDLCGAALTNEITEVSIPVGSRLPFMSSRENRKPVCLRDVLWDGKEPIQAYAFTFSSLGRRYRCVTPKPCSNFFLEDLGVPAILVELVDLEDPVEVGQQVTYVITITNQGDPPGSNVRFLVNLPASQEFVSGSGATRVLAQDRTIKTEPLPTLAGKAKASWRVVVKVLQPDDARFKVEVSSDQFEKPIRVEESTRLY